MLTAQTTEPQVLSQDALDQLFFDARTINTYSGEPLTEQQMREVYELASLPPTMMNAQPLRIDWVEGEARTKVSEIMGGSNGAKIAAAPTVAVLSYDVDFHKHLGFTFPHFEGAEAAFADEGPRADRALENGWLQAAYFIMALRSRGFSAGPMTGGDLNAVSEYLNEGTARRVFLIVTIGQPGEDAYFPRLPRFEFDQVNRVVS